MVSTLADAYAYAPSFMVAHTARFPKPPKSDFNAHRPLRADENLDLVRRERRKVTKSLTAQYHRVMYLLGDTSGNRQLIDRTSEVWKYPGWAHRTPDNTRRDAACNRIHCMIASDVPFEKPECRPNERGRPSQPCIIVTIWSNSTGPTAYEKLCLSPLAVGMSGTAH